MKKRTLTPRQERFVREYLVDLNATQAAIRAGYSAKTADRIGPNLIGKSCVARAIERGKAKLFRKLELKPELVLQRLREEGDYRGEGASHAARVSAWKAIGEYFALFTKNLKHSGNVALNVGGDVIREVLKRPDRRDIIRRAIDEIVAEGDQPARPSANGHPQPVPGGHPPPPPE